MEKARGKSSEKAAVSMEASSRQTLQSAENLTLPKEQVVVMTANMSCNHCRMRVSRVVSKMNRLLDYTVDMTKKEVTMRGVIVTEKRGTRPTKKKRSLRLFGLECFGAT